MMARRSPHGPSKTTSKPRVTYRRWKTPGDIHDTASRFAIDDQIRKAPLQSRWQLGDAVAFGRRTLEVAIEEASRNESYQPGKILARWKRTAMLAERAHRTLKQFITHVEKTGVSSSDALGPSIRVPKSWTPSGRISIGIVQRFQSREDTERGIEALRKAREILQELAVHAQQRRDRLARARKNEGDPGKRAFVHSLAEGWIFLTGRKPGRNFVSTHNPFLRFVKAAWTDAGFGDDENFSRALESTLTALANSEGWSWSDQSRETIKGLATHGPTWM
jgi:hypothetical protein